MDKTLFFQPVSAKFKAELVLSGYTPTKTEYIFLKNKFQEPKLSVFKRKNIKIWISQPSAEQCLYANIYFSERNKLLGQVTGGNIFQIANKVFQKLSRLKEAA